MIFKTRIALALTAACLVSTPAIADQDKGERREGKKHEQQEKERDKRADRKDRAGRGGGQAHAKVPPGHLPPPGECRIWFPDRPPGHQPPPGDCHELSRRAPPGAVLVEGG